MVMSLDDAILHCKEKAKELDDGSYIDFINNKITVGEMFYCRVCAAEHLQLAAWLTELKQRRENDQKGGKT